MYTAMKIYSILVCALPAQQLQTSLPAQQPQTPPIPDSDNAQQPLAPPSTTVSSIDTIIYIEDSNADGVTPCSPLPDLNHL